MRTFIIPFEVDPRPEAIDRLRLFVSLDQGKTWKHAKDAKPTDGKFTYTAPKDGLYWFAVQTVLKDGKNEPEEKDFDASLKLYVNQERKAVRKPAKSLEDLQREVEELQRTVAQLRRKIKALEDERKTK